MYTCCLLTVPGNLEQKDLKPFWAHVSKAQNIDGYEIINDEPQPAVQQMCVHFWSLAE